MSGLVSEGITIAEVLIERLSPDLAKLLGVALGGGIGAGAYKYLQPHFAGRGFDNSRKEAKKSGISVGRAIGGGNPYRISGGPIIGPSLQSKTVKNTYRRHKKHLSVRRCHCKWYGGYVHHSTGCKARRPRRVRCG